MFDCWNATLGNIQPVTFESTPHYIQKGLQYDLEIIMYIVFLADKTEVLNVTCIR